MFRCIRLDHFRRFHWLGSAERATWSCSSGCQEAQQIVNLISICSCTNQGWCCCCCCRCHGSRTGETGGQEGVYCLSVALFPLCLFAIGFLSLCFGKPSASCRLIPSLSYFDWSSSKRQARLAVVGCTCTYCAALLTLLS